MHPNWEILEYFPEKCNCWKAGNVDFFTVIWWTIFLELSQTEKPQKAWGKRSTLKNATIPKHKTSLATKKRGLNLTKKSPFNPLVSGLKGRQKWSCPEVWLERGELFYSREYGMWGLREPPFYPEAPVVFLLWYSSKSVSQGQENRASRSWG